MKKQDVEDEMKIIQDAQLQKLIKEKGNYTLIDVRGKSELPYGMIPTAKHIPLGEIEEALQLKDAEFQRKYGFPKPQKNDNLIFHCRTGGRSAAATQTAVNLGFKAKNYAGSIWEWSLHDSKVKRYGLEP